MVLDKFWDLVLFLVRPTKCRARVTFSPSTLHREMLRQSKLTPSNNPFFNFLAEMRLKVAANAAAYGPKSMLNCSNLSKTAGQVWKSMSDLEKAPYRMIAYEQRKLKRLKRPRRRYSVTGRRPRRRKHHGQMFGRNSGNSNYSDLQHYNNINFNRPVSKRNTPRSVRMPIAHHTYDYNDDDDQSNSSNYYGNFLDQEQQANELDDVNDSNSKLSLCSLNVTPSVSSIGSQMNSPLTQKVLQAMARVKGRE